MPTNVTELRGSLANIEADTVLIFPNIITCVALIVVSGGTLIGAHMTGVDAPADVGAAVLGRAGGPVTAAYAVGPISYNGMDLSALGIGIAIERYDTTMRPGGVDVRATLNGGHVTIEKKAHGDPDSAYREISRAHFSCCTIL